jgi:hypothetical protein
MPGFKSLFVKLISQGLIHNDAKSFVLVQNYLMPCSNGTVRQAKLQLYGQIHCNASGEMNAWIKSKFLEPFFQVRIENEEI